MSLKEIKKVVTRDGLSQISEYWDPHIAGELNGQYVKLAKLKGEFTWHKHDEEDELFYIISGHLKIELRDKVLQLDEGEFVIIPKGIEHRPVADNEVHIMLFEPKSTLNTGDKDSGLTRKELKRLK